METVYDIFRRVNTLEVVHLNPNMQYPHGEQIEDFEDSSSDEEEFVTSEDVSDYGDESEEHDSNVNELEVRDYRDFLACQTNLRTLNISGDEFFSRRFVNCTFQLSKLCLSMCLHGEESNHLLAFLFEQSNIKQLTLNIKPAEGYPTSKWNLQRAIDYILKLNTLQLLRLMIYDLTTMQFFKNCQIVNKNISKLYLRLCAMGFFHQRIIETAANMFPGVERLHLDLEQQWMNTELTTPQTFEPLNEMPKLRYLTLEHLNPRFITTLKLQNIKHLILTNNPEEDPEQTAANLEIFFKNNPNHRKFPNAWPLTSIQYEQNLPHHYVRI